MRDAAGRETPDLAVGRWHGILLALGVDDRALTGKHGPCPVCGGKDRFRFDDLDGRGTYYCSQCGPGDGFHLVQNYLGLDDFKDAARRVDEILGNTTIRVRTPRPKPDGRSRLVRIGAGLQPLTGDDPVSKYLAGRGLMSAPATLRWHPGLEYWDRDDDGRPVMLGTYNAMVALVTGPTGRRVTYHATYLEKRDDGGYTKADVPSPKKILSAGIEGAAARLYPAGQVLAVGEGIETTLAVRAMAADAGEAIPVWAALTANGMRALELPPEVEELRVYGDNDASFTGQAAAYELARRAVAQGRRVKVFIPRDVGVDFLDEWRAGDGGKDEG